VTEARGAAARRARAGSRGGPAVRVAASPAAERLPRVDMPRLRRRARRLLRAVGAPRAELSIALFSDAAMRELNQRWRGRPRPTDVLSFSLLEGEGARHRGALLGDVVLGVEIAARQARARHRTLDEELARLLIHGTLHLLGHDHRRPGQARIMRAEERRLWALLRD
jgi:probable rRNA maturation factor